MAEKINGEAEASVLEALLNAAPNVEKELPTARYEVERLSALAGRPVTFRLRALPYGRVRDLARFTQDADVNILLAGCAEPDLKDPRLLEKFQAPTPAEAVKKLLLPGEIADLSNAIERLTGYRRSTIKEIKKRLKDGGDAELGLLYYLFSAHHWGLGDLRALWEGETGWHDLIYALSSYEANERKSALAGARKKHGNAARLKNK